MKSKDKFLGSEQNPYLAAYRARQDLIGTLGAIGYKFNVVARIRKTTLVRGLGKLKQRKPGRFWTGVVSAGLFLVGLGAWVLARKFGRR